MALHSHPSRTPSSDCLLAANANTARGPPSRSRQPVPGPARTCRKLPGRPFLLPGGSPKPYGSTSAAPGPAEKLPSTPRCRTSQAAPGGCSRLRKGSVAPRPPRSPARGQQPVGTRPGVAAFPSRCLEKIKVKRVFLFDTFTVCEK